MVSDNMRIAYSYPEPLPAQNARSIQVINTCVALAKLAGRVTLYADQVGSNQNMFHFYGLHQLANLHLVPISRDFGPFKSNLWFNQRLKKAIRTQPSQIVLTRHLKVARALLDNQIPIIFEAHEIFGHKAVNGKRNFSIEKQVFENAQGIMYLSFGLKRDLERLYKPTVPHIVIPSGTEVYQSLPQKTNHNMLKVRITYVGSSRYNWKGVDVLLEALTWLPDTIGLDIVGELAGNLMAKKKVPELIESGKLSVTGPLPPPEAALRLKDAVVAVIPNTGEDSVSRYYTSPLKLLEAMAAGVAVVASDLPSIREIVSENEAVLVKPGDPQSLVEGIMRVIKDRKLRAKLVHGAWKRVQEFSWETRAKKIMTLIQEVLAK
jgi:glycosyltransferase involved in cell wall biosynthesis